MRVSAGDARILVNLVFRGRVFGAACSASLIKPIPQSVLSGKRARRMATAILRTRGPGKELHSEALCIVFSG